MHKIILKKSLLYLSLLTFIIQMTPLFAQTLEIEVLGGGYRLEGPEAINFDSHTSSFSINTSTVDFYDLSFDNNDQIENPGNHGSLIITDENGGSPFSVTVSASTLTSGSNTIPQTNFLINNIDNDEAHAAKDTLNGSASDFTLSNLGANPSADDEGYISFSEGSIVLGSGSGEAPGRWRIYPSLKIVIPSGQEPGTYTSTLTFTIQ